MSGNRKVALAKNDISWGTLSSKNMVYCLKNLLSPPAMPWRRRSDIKLTRLIAMLYLIQPECLE